MAAAPPPPRRVRLRPAFARMYRSVRRDMSYEVLGVAGDWGIWIRTASEPLRSDESLAPFNPGRRFVLAYHVEPAE